MAVAVADTHTVIWYLFDDARLSTRAREAIESVAGKNQIVAVSSISLVEIVYLEERHRIPAGTRRRMFDALRDPSTVLQEVPVDTNIADALSRVDAAQIPDMPDRIIAATALHLQVPIISRDSKIRASEFVTIW